MDKSLKQQIQKRERMVGWIILGAWLLVGIFCYRVCYPFADGNLLKLDRTIREPLIIAMFGGMAGASVPLMVWIALGSSRLLSRVTVVSLGCIAFGAAWLLGFMGSFDQTVGVNFSHHEEMYYLGLIPAILFVFAIPMFCFRFATGKVLHSIYEDPPVHQRLSIGKLMGATTIVAGIAAASQIPQVLGNSVEDIFWLIAMAAAWFGGVSLLVCLPIIAVLFGRKLSFFVFSILMGAFVIGLVPFGFQLFEADQLAVIGVACGTFAGYVMFTSWILAMRYWGYRLIPSVQNQGVWEKSR